MLEVLGGDEFALPDLLCGLADKNAVHDDLTADGNVLKRELMFGRNFREQDQRAFTNRDLFATF